MLFCVFADVALFRDKSSDVAIYLFVGTPFPSAIRMAVVYGGPFRIGLHTGRLQHQPTKNLIAIIQGYALELPGKPLPKHRTL